MESVLLSMKLLERTLVQLFSWFLISSCWFKEDNCNTSKWTILEDCKIITPVIGSYVSSFQGHKTTTYSGFPIHWLLSHVVLHDQLLQLPVIL